VPRIWLEVWKKSSRVVYTQNVSFVMMVNKIRVHSGFNRSSAQSTLLSVCVVLRRPPVRKDRPCSECRVQCAWRMTESFFPVMLLTFLRRHSAFNRSQTFTLPLQVLHAFLSWEDYHNFHLAFGALFAFWEADFHKIKGRETLRDHTRMW
jgi:hypothetical protein